MLAENVTNLNVIDDALVPFENLNNKRLIWTV